MSTCRQKFSTWPTTDVNGWQLESFLVPWWSSSSWSLRSSLDGGIHRDVVIILKWWAFSLWRRGKDPYFHHSVCRCTVPRREMQMLHPTIFVNFPWPPMISLHDFPGAPLFNIAFTSFASKAANIQYTTYYIFVQSLILSLFRSWYTIMMFHEIISYLKTSFIQSIFLVKHHHKMYWSVQFWTTASVSSSVPYALCRPQSCIKEKLFSFKNVACIYSTYCCRLQKPHGAASGCTRSGSSIEIRRFPSFEKGENWDPDNGTPGYPISQELDGQGVNIVFVAHMTKAGKF